MCECPGTQCHCEVLTAYARECERKGVRIPRWREETGCKHVTPFKYSGEVVTSAEVSSHVDANLNEVLTEPGEEVEEEFEEEMAALPLSKLGHTQAGITVSPSIREKRRREKEKELRRRERARKKKERRRQKRLKKKRQEKRRSMSHSSSSSNSDSCSMQSPHSSCWPAQQEPLPTPQQDLGSNLGSGGIRCTSYIRV